eukprot:1180620-Prorocentrum_minimum.AAC.1
MEEVKRRSSQQATLTKQPRNPCPRNFLLSNCKAIIIVDLLLTELLTDALNCVALSNTAQHFERLMDSEPTSTECLCHAKGLKTLASATNELGASDELNEKWFSSSCCRGGCCSLCSC